jgi:hypothetical protein
VKREPLTDTADFEAKLSLDDVTQGVMLPGAAPWTCPAIERSASPEALSTCDPSIRSSVRVRTISDSSGQVEKSPALRKRLTVVRRSKG